MIEICEICGREQEYECYPPTEFNPEEEWILAACLCGEPAVKFNLDAALRVCFPDEMGMVDEFGQVKLL